MSAPRPAVLKGEPMRLDVVYRPMAWFLLVPPGGLASLLLWWWGYALTAPLPFVGAWCLHTWIFWMRGDRPCRLTLGHDVVSLEDPRREHRVDLSVAEIHSATLTLRSRSDGGSTAVLSLWDEDGPRLAVRAAVPRVTASKEEIDGDLISASIGGDGGTAYAFAPVGSVGRQLIRDPKGDLIAWYRRLAPEVRARTSLRVWPGLAPTLDLLGRHEEAWGGIIDVDNGDAVLRPDEPLGPAWRWGHASRQALLLQTPDGLTGTTQATLDLAVLRFEGHTIAFPAGLAADLGESVELDEHTLHTHSGEGAALLTALLHHTPRAQWPQALSEALLDARAYLGGPPGELA